MNALASNWRLSGILTARSGSRLNVTSGVDRAFNGAFLGSAADQRQR